MFSSVRTTSLMAAATIANYAREAVPECVCACVHVFVRAQTVLRKTHALMCILCVHVVCNGQPYTGLYASVSRLCILRQQQQPAAANRQAQRIDDCRRAAMCFLLASRLASAASGWQYVHILCKVRERESPSPPPPQHSKSTAVGRNLCTCVHAFACVRGAAGMCDTAGCMRHRRHAVREGVVRPAR